MTATELFYDEVACLGSARRLVDCSRTTGGGARSPPGVSVIAQGKLARALVYSGRKQKTQSGMTTASVIRSKPGKIVSQKAPEREPRRTSQVAESLRPYEGEVGQEDS